jgi:hypothetical protein
MTANVTQTAKAKVIEVINQLNDNKISIRSVAGVQTVYITVETEGDRSDARNKIGAALKKAKFSIEEKLSTKSSETATFVKTKNVVIVYKNKKGGMAETTLNSSITELFPAIAFENNISETLNEQQFYTKIQQAYNKNSNVFIGNDWKAGKGFIDQAVHSSKFTEKVQNAKGVLKYIKEQNKGKSISQVYWGYRAKPPGVNANHPGDIFLKYTDGKILGVSLKAGGATTREPKLNTYVRKTIFTAFSDPTTYEKWQKESYDKFYTKIPNIPSYNDYGKPNMVNACANLERDDSSYYDELYDAQLEWLRDKMIDYLNNDCDKTKKWLLEEVAHVDLNVPNVVVKAIRDTWEIVNDDDVVKECVQRSKKGCAGINAKKSTTSKQSIIITLTCRDHPTHLDFTIRTNKAGVQHKLGQFINLAFKFNGVIN